MMHLLKRFTKGILQYARWLVFLHFRAALLLGCRVQKTFHEGKWELPFPEIAVLITISLEAWFSLFLFRPHNLSSESLALSLLLNSSSVCNTVPEKVLGKASRNKERACMKDRLEGSKGDRLGMKDTLREVVRIKQATKVRNQELLLEIKKRAKEGWGAKSEQKASRYKETIQNYLMMEHFAWGQNRSNEV